MVISTTEPFEITQFENFIKTSTGYKPPTLTRVSNLSEYTIFYEKYSQDPQVAIHNEQLPQPFYKSPNCIAFRKMIGGERILYIIFLFVETNIYIGITEHPYGKTTIQVLLTYNSIDKELVLPDPIPDKPISTNNTPSGFEIAFDHTKNLYKKINPPIHLQGGYKNIYYNLLTKLNYSKLH